MKEYYHLPQPYLKKEQCRWCSLYVHKSFLVYQTVTWACLFLCYSFIITHFLIFEIHDSAMMLLLAGTRKEKILEKEIEKINKVLEKKRPSHSIIFHPLSPLSAVDYWLSFFMFNFFVCLKSTPLIR